MKISCHSILPELNRACPKMQCHFATFLKSGKNISFICHWYVCQRYITCNVYITENKMYYTVLLLSYRKINSQIKQNDEYLYLYIDVSFNLLKHKLFSKFKGPLQRSSFKLNFKHDFQDVQRYIKYPLISNS